MQKFVVTRVDYGMEYDGKAKVLGIFYDLIAAQEYIQADMEETVDNSTSERGECLYTDINFDSYSIWNGNGDGKEWGISEIED